MLIVDLIPELKAKFLPFLFLTPQELIRPKWFFSNQAVEAEEIHSKEATQDQSKSMA